MPKGARTRPEAHLTLGVNRYRMTMTEMRRLETVACRRLKTNSQSRKTYGQEFRPILTTPEGGSYQIRQVGDQ